MLQFLSVATSYFSTESCFVYGDKHCQLWIRLGDLDFRDTSVAVLFMGTSSSVRAEEGGAQQ